MPVEMERLQPVPVGYHRESMWLIGEDDVVSVEDRRRYQPCNPSRLYNEVFDVPDHS